MSTPTTKLKTWLALSAGLTLAMPAIADEQPGKKTEEATPEGETPTAESSTDEPPDDSRSTALTARMVLKVIHPDAVREALLEETRRLGGFPILVTDDSVQLKVPPAQLSALLRRVGEEGLVIEKTMERQDLTETIAQLSGQLRSKGEILRRLREFFDDSEVAATLRIEEEMTNLVAELERVKGELRVATERARWAVVVISFKFRKRDRIIYVHSPFDWLNSVDLGRFLEEF